MKDPSERARLVLARYKAATSPPAADKARLLELVQQRGLRGDLPRFHVQTAIPIAPTPSLPLQIWGSTLGKAGLAVAALGLSALGVYENHEGHGVPSVHSGSAVIAAAPQAAATVVPPVSTEQAPPPVEGDPPRVASALPHAKADKTDSAASAASAEPTIDEEIKLMNGAQAALHAGDPRRALQLLSEHARRFPNGKLASARAVTHMIALCALGRADDARLEAERFLAKTPNSPFAERVRNVCSPARESP